ncbi:phosphatidylinositol 4,5-bisphosphate 3-kinase catalytic subunit beta isoform [Apostichopus japonicus]|uniref:Phosphatidylinositol 4,5-bisphosphate 3-kinase catalytic subunit beta isoform n=1 Tax=Stichopus japonicus TaxID=307972 RepID=A0A2G8JWQ9_STIJA|nr:phosphatidylinositol 4,5-bisphosphate 3-kinase catalytic subunit beta isoform [Apostichopus japonicus]
MGSCPYDYTVAEEARCFCQTYSFILCCFATKIVINVENISHDMQFSFEVPFVNAKQGKIQASQFRHKERMPPASWTNHDFWHQQGLVKTVELLCLLPNGIIVPLRCERESTLSAIKRELWDVASRFPVYNQLLDLNFYNFQCVQEGGEREELLEERKRISDIRPFCNTLTVVRKAGDAEEKVLNSRIGILIGKSLHEFDNMKSQEIVDFRQKTRNICMTIQKERLKWDWENRAVYLFPPQLESSADMHNHVREAFKDDKFLVSVVFSDGPVSK